MFKDLNAKLIRRPDLTNIPGSDFVLKTVIHKKVASIDSIFSKTTHHTKFGLYPRTPTTFDSVDGYTARGHRIFDAIGDHRAKEIFDAIMERQQRAAYNPNAGDMFSFEIRHMDYMSGRSGGRFHIDITGIPGVPVCVTPDRKTPDDVSYEDIVSYIGAEEEFLRFARSCARRRPLRRKIYNNSARYPMIYNRATGELRHLVPMFSSETRCVETQSMLSNDEILTRYLDDHDLKEVATNNPEIFT